MPRSYVRISMTLDTAMTLEGVLQGDLDNGLLIPPRGEYWDPRARAARLALEDLLARLRDLIEVAEASNE